MDGFLNVLKPSGMSSGDVVWYIRKRLPKGTKIGHGGTLDEDACGVLPVCVGSAVRLFDYIIDKTKVYLGEITLGISTDTQDATGNIISSRDAGGIGKDEIAAVLPSFIGDLIQIPPAYSAVKKNGERLYRIARSGGDAAVPGRAAYVENIEYIAQTGEHSHLLRVSCGKGVYIRTLFNDIGDKLGCGAHMSMLIREKAGIFDINSSLMLSQAEAAIEEGRLVPLDAPLGKLTRVDIGEQYLHYVKNGNQLKTEWLVGAVQPGDTVRLYMDDAFIGIGEITSQGTMRFKAMLKRFEQDAALT